jgi:hypothetical protein
VELEALVVGQDATVDDVGDASFEAAAGFLGCLVFGDLSSVVVASGAGITGLGDRCDVDGRVELAVALAPASSIDFGFVQTVFVEPVTVTLLFATCARLPQAVDQSMAYRW